MRFRVAKQLVCIIVWAPRSLSPPQTSPGYLAIYDTQQLLLSLLCRGAEHVGSATFASGLRGLLGGASSRLLGSLMGRASSSSKADADEEEEELWFTSLDDFKPICHMLHRCACTCGCCLQTCWVC